MLYFILVLLVLVTIAQRVINDKAIRDVVFDIGYVIVAIAIAIQAAKSINFSLEQLKFAGILALIGLLVLVLVKDFVKKND